MSNFDKFVPEFLKTMSTEHKVMLGLGLVAAALVYYEWQKHSEPSVPALPATLPTAFGQSYQQGYQQGKVAANAPLSPQQIALAQKAGQQFQALSPQQQAATVISQESSPFSQMHDIFALASGSPMSSTQGMWGMV